MEEKIGKKIGSGGTSDVYEWGEKEVLKLYKSHVDEHVIRNEIHIVQLLNEFSLNIPKYIGCINYQNQRGLIYERVYGHIMAQPLLDGVYDTVLAARFAKMHFDIHQKVIGKLPLQYNFLKNRIIELSDFLGDRAEILLNLLDNIPAGNQLCHGDFQPLNIIGDDDKYTVIDWNGACIGNPVLDVAWSFMTLNSPIIKQVLGERISEVFIRFTKDYLLCYCELSGLNPKQILICLPIVATRRLYDNRLNDMDNSRLERDWLWDVVNTIS